MRVQLGQEAVDEEQTTHDSDRRDVMQGGSCERVWMSTAVRVPAQKWLIEPAARCNRRANSDGGAPAYRSTRHLRGRRGPVCAEPGEAVQPYSTRRGFG